MKRWCVRAGALPTRERTFSDALERLVPVYIQALPHDVITGGKLHYRVTAGGGYVLYSVGWNETDEGGQEAVRDGRDGRFVDSHKATGSGQSVRIEK